jgi:HlyD family secretion protein
MKKLTMVIPLLILLTGCAKSDFRLGYVETDEIDVAVKIPGRVLGVKVREGDRVKAGDPLALLQSDDIRARVEQARAGQEAAQAQLAMALNGARAEEKRMAERQLNIARANLEIMQLTHERIMKVFADGGVSLQEKDASAFRLNVAQEQYEQARAYRDMVVNGARREQIEALRAGVKAAAEKLAEAQSYLDETLLHAPGDGEVRAVNAQAGEMVSAGFALITLLDPHPYVIFNLREDEFRSLKLNDEVKAEIPALGRSVTLTVYYLAPLADFARYESTQEKGSWDVRTFEVRARIKEGTAAVRPGMSVKIFRP